MNAIDAVTPLSGQPPANAKAVKAAKDFEAVLLNAVFSDLQTAFTDLPGKTLSNSAKAYNGIAMQALASGLSRGRGIGLGTVVAQWLEHRQASGIRHPALGDEIKPLE